MPENWKQIPSEPGYEVSDLGRVRSVDRVVQAKKGPRRCPGKELKPGLSSNGYLTVACGFRNSRLVHELLLEAFFGPRPFGMIGFHRDDVRTDNTKDNLKWATPSSNNKNITRLGGRRFTYAEADQIRLRLKSGETPLQVAADVGCTRRHIYHINNGVQYVAD